MGIEITKPPAAPTLTASLQSGGELLPNTTYQFRIAGKNTSSYSFGAYNRYQTEVSEVISITTTDTYKSIKLEWNHVNPYDYYMIACKRDYDDEFGWKTLQVSSSGNYTKKATNDIECNLILNKWVSYTNGGQLNKYGWRLMLAQYGYDSPVDKLAGIGRIRIYGSNGNLKISDLVSSIQSAGLNPAKYFKFDGITLYSRMHIYIDTNATGTLDLENFNIYPVQCSISNTSSNFTLKSKRTRYSTNAWSLRFDTGRMELVETVIMGGTASGWKSVAVILGGDNYVNIGGNSNLGNCTILGIRVQLLEGAVIENIFVAGGGFNVMGWNVKIRESKATNYIYFGNIDFSNFVPGSDYEIRNINQIDDSNFDVRIHYNNVAITLFDYKGERGKKENGDYNKPYVYWSNSAGYNTILNLAHNFKFRILDADFNPLSDVSIKLTNANGDEIEITTNAAGEAGVDFIVATVTHSNGAYGSNYNDYNPITIEIYKPGYERFTWQGIVEQEKMMEIVLKEVLLPIAEELEFNIYEESLNIDLTEDIIEAEVIEEC